MFDYFGVMFVPLFSKKAKISKWAKKPGNRTNMDITLSFLAKSLDKHGITLVHVTYPPLGHHNFVVIAPMIMKCGTGVKLDVFYTTVAKYFVTSLLLCHYDVITSVLADA